MEDDSIDRRPPPVSADTAVNPDAGLPSVPSPNLEGIGGSVTVQEHHESMLDVHAPHTSVHTWKDFFIHIVAISVGLLIAIGLEQIVENFHHCHQRQRLEEDRQSEGLRNREIVERDIAYLDALNAWSLRANRAVRAAEAGHGQPPMQYPDRFSNDPAMRKSLRYLTTTAAVWTTAKESGAIALLPRDEARTYTRLYRLHDVIVGVDFEWRRSGTAMSGIEIRFSPTPETPPDLAPMSAAQLDQLSSAVMQDYASAVSLKSMLRAFRWANEAVLGGVRSEKGIVDSIYREQLNLAGAAPTVTPSAADSVLK
jgi:hypothetical protein